MSDFGDLEPGTYEGVVLRNYLTKDSAGNKSIFGQTTKGYHFFTLGVYVKGFGEIKAKVMSFNLNKVLKDTGLKKGDIIAQAKNGDLDINLKKLNGITLIVKAEENNYTDKNGVEKKAINYNIEGTGMCDPESLKQLQDEYPASEENADLPF